MSEPKNGAARGFFHSESLPGRCYSGGRFFNLLSVIRVDAFLIKAPFDTTRGRRNDASRSTIRKTAPSVSTGSSGKSIRLRPRRGNADRIRSRREIVCV